MRERKAAARSAAQPAQAAASVAAASSAARSMPPPPAAGRCVAARQRGVAWYASCRDKRLTRWGSFPTGILDASHPWIKMKCSLPNSSPYSTYPATLTDIALALDSSL